MTGATNVGAYGPTNRDDPFGDILEVNGPMLYTTPVHPAEAELYRGRLPDGLLDFWVRHGRGALHGGYGWICDPAMMVDVLNTVFEGDPEYSVQDFSAYYYTYEGKINAWSRTYHNARISITGFRPTVDIVGVGPNLVISGNHMSGDLAVGHVICGAGHELAHDREIDFDQFTEATTRLGALQPGQIFGFFPSRQVGGEGHVEDMRRVKAVEHLLFHAQLQRATLMRYVYDPNDLANPYGRQIPIRRLGPQEN